MQKLILILILIFGLDLYSQEAEYKPISESDIRVNYETLTDTINIKKSRIALKWKILKPETKEKIRHNISEKKKDIESDTSDLTRISYFGNKTNVGLKINGKLLKTTSSIPEYNYKSIFGDSIFKINLGTIPRYSEIQSAELIFADLKRTAKIQLDTKYSIIDMEVEYIENLSEILKREKEVDENRKKLEESGKEPEIPNTIEVIEDEVVLIKHKIPKRKHGW